MVIIIFTERNGTLENTEQLCIK